MLTQTDTFTPEAHQAVVECLKVFAARGRQIRKEREQACGDPILGRMIAVAWRMGLESVIGELLALQSEWNKRGENEAIGENAK